MGFISFGGRYFGWGWGWGCLGLPKPMPGYVPGYTFTIYNISIIIIIQYYNAIQLGNIKGVNFFPCTPPLANGYDIAPLN